MQGDLHARLLWNVEHDRQAVVELLAETIPADVLRDALERHPEQVAHRS